MNKYIEELIKKINGSLIGIGIKEKNIINLIEKNNKIIECNLLDCYMDDEEEKGKSKKIKKLRKKFKKHKTDTIICNIERIEDIKDKFIYDSIFIVKKNIYLYGNMNESIIRRYSRYGTVNIIEKKDGNIFEIKITKKITKFNENYYKFIDKVVDYIEIISNIL